MTQGNVDLQESLQHKSGCGAPAPRCAWRGVNIDTLPVQ
jgi:hypothetical protein